MSVRWLAVWRNGESIRQTPYEIADARVVKRSLVIAGHRTSISLEDAFWRRLRRIAADRGLSLNRLAAIVDASRGRANLSSAIRVFVLEAEGASRGHTAADGAAPPDQ
ncbi:MAG TPA: ribbon-helix-helix domain-containing protein [Roseiarcus sp.]|nr:ribbon-helix-helix domain-containing protein [Roseiarcus sp.]